jgi:hypothetical protein
MIVDKLVYSGIKDLMKSERMRLANLAKHKVRDLTAINVYLNKLTSLKNLEKFVAQGNGGRGFVYAGPKIKPRDEKDKIMTKK